MQLPRWAKRAATTTALALTAGSLVAMPTPAFAAEPIPIADIQGAGAETSLVGSEVTTEPSYVTAVYGPGSGQFNGIVIQSPGTGAGKDLASGSDAIFVYLGNNPFEVAVGDLVSVTGTAGEYNGLTQIGGTVTIEPATGDLEAPTPVTTAWADTAGSRENLESMLYLSDESFTVSDTYPLLPYGELGLVSGTELPVQPTDAGAPGSDEAAAQADANLAAQVNLDDGTNRGFYGGTLPFLTAKEDVTIGDSLRIDDPVVIDYRNGKWKFNPTGPSEAGSEVATITPADAPKPPRPGGDVSVASFNVLNYFTTVGEGRTDCAGGNEDTDGGFNVTFDCDVRGAWDSADLERQQAKIVSAINELEASVVGLMEIENSAKLGEDPDEATATLVDALNVAAGSEKWDFVPSSTELQDVADQDVITNAIIYQPSAAELNGEAHALGADAGADGAFANARTPIAAAFTSTEGGAPTLVVVNHFKSKSSGGATGDNADVGDGQAAYNGDRSRQAQALVDWLPAVQDQTGANSVALVGDFNSYSQEDPMQILYAAGYERAAPADEYSYSFSGLAGSLDHVLLNGEAAKRMTGAAVWNINAGESAALEYSNYKTTSIDYYEADQFRSSDHDPVIVGLEAGGQESTTLTLLNFNDFHGRIAPEFPDTAAFFGTVEEQREAAGEDNTLLLAAGDNVGASLFASSVQQDQPTIDVLNVAELDASAVGNHEFDKGFADLTGRITDEADWDYLGANVYEKGTTTPALPEYALFERGDLTVGVIGAVTGETGSLVSPAGIADIEFGDPVDAVNRVAGQLKDGDEANGEADVLIAEYHEGAVEGLPNGTLEAEVSKGGAFDKIVNETSADVAAVFTAHTHQEYAWDGPIPGVEGKTRPILQSESYGELLGKVTLDIDPVTNEVTSYTRENLSVTETPVDELVVKYPRVAKIKQIVDDALIAADEIGSVVIGEATAPITRAFVDSDEGPAENRAAESTVSNLVANMFRDSLADPLRGGAEIGVQNPGGNRADLDLGDITFSEAAAVLPFANSLFTLDLTGAEFKTLLEQQWQTNEDGSPFTGSRPYLQLGLSDNVSYTFDADQPEGSRITSITIDDAPYDPERVYRIGTASFLASGGDNFHAFKNAANKKDTGLIDLDSWTDYIRAEQTISPSFAKQAVGVKPLPTELVAGETTTFEVSTLDLTSLGSPENTTLVATLNDEEIGTFSVSEGASTVALEVPATATDGPGKLILTGPDSNTEVQLAVDVIDAEVAEPSLTVTPDEVVAGRTITASAKNFPAGAQIDIVLRSDPVRLGTLTAGNDGSATGEFTIPANTPVGSHELTATAGDVTATVSLTVNAASSATPSPGPSSSAPDPADPLPNTGADAGPGLLMLTGISVLGGAALVSRGRFRHS